MSKKHISVVFNTKKDVKGEREHFLHSQGKTNSNRQKTKEGSSRGKLPHNYSCALRDVVCQEESSRG